MNLQLPSPEVKKAAEQCLKGMVFFSRRCFFQDNALPQAFTVEDSGTETDEEAQPKQASRAAPLQGASGAERQAVLERLQGQDHPLAAGFKVGAYISVGIYVWQCIA